MSFINLSPTDLVVSNDGVTAPAWTTGNPTLEGTGSMFIVDSTAPTFYTDVYATSSVGLSSVAQFSVSYGNISGSSATLFNPLVQSASATRTIYNQFRNLVYADENTSFNFGSGSTATPDIFVINVNRQCYKESLFPGTFNLKLSGSTAIHLTNDSNDTTTINYLDCGRVYNIVTGSNGYRSTAADKTGTSGSYGLFLPDVGVIILNPRALSAPAVSGGINLTVSNALPAAFSNSVNQNNQKGLARAIASGSFTLNSYETVSSDYVFVRVPNNQFNYTTNPSVISGSGALLFSTMINNPQTYITTIGMYNDNQECLAVAKLSKPLVKDFTKEALIQVKLNW